VQLLDIPDSKGRPLRSSDGRWTTLMAAVMFIVGLAGIMLVSFGLPIRALLIALLLVNLPWVINWVIQSLRGRMKSRSDEPGENGEDRDPDATPRP